MAPKSVEYCEPLPNYPNPTTDSAIIENAQNQIENAMVVIQSATSKIVQAKAEMEKAQVRTKVHFSSLAVSPTTHITI
jgi:hypothetical protein